ncbi:hypothetical protein [Escherichia coli Nissle 1917]|nr:hypothetical protein [Escherichia coli Nissle 1917]
MLGVTLGSKMLHPVRSTVSNAATLCTPGYRQFMPTMAISLSL